MEGSYTKFGYPKWNGIQDLVCFLINYFFAILAAVLEVFQNLLYDEGDQNLQSTYSKSVNTEFPFDPGLLTFPHLMMTLFRVMSLKKTKLTP